MLCGKVLKGKKLPAWCRSCGHRFSIFYFVWVIYLIGELSGLTPRHLARPGNLSNLLAEQNEPPKAASLVQLPACRANRLLYEGLTAQLLTPFKESASSPLLCSERQIWPLLSDHKVLPRLYPIWAAPQNAFRHASNSAPPPPPTRAQNHCHPMPFWQVTAVSYGLGEDSCFKVNVWKS